MYEAVAGLKSEQFQFASPRLNVTLAIVLQSFL